MSVSTIGIDPKRGYRLIVDTDCNATAEINVAGGRCRIRSIHVNNSANSAVSYVKIYDSAVTITVGTTAPDFIIPCVGSGTNGGFSSHSFTNADGLGVPLTNGLSIACVTAGGTSGTTSPTGGAVIVTLYVEDI